MKEYRKRPEVKARRREYRKEYDNRPEEVAHRKAYAKAYHQRNKEKNWARSLARNFGITAEEYYKMLEEQNGVCAICRKPESAKHNEKIRKLAVDHDHKTGEIRGLLCSNCNTGLGGFKSSLALLHSAEDYLLNSRSATPKNQVNLRSSTP